MDPAAALDGPFPGEVDAGELAAFLDRRVVIGAGGLDLGGVKAKPAVLAAEVTLGEVLAVPLAVRDSFVLGV